MWCDVMWCDVMWCDENHIFSLRASLSLRVQMCLCVYSTAVEPRWVLKEHNSEKKIKHVDTSENMHIYSPKPHCIPLNLHCWPLSLRVLMCLCMYSTGVEPRWVLEEDNYYKTYKIYRQKWKHAHLLTKTTSSFSQSSLRASLSSCSVVSVYVLNWCWALVSSTIT